MNLVAGASARAREFRSSSIAPRKLANVSVGVAGRKPSVLAIRTIKTIRPKRGKRGVSATLTIGASTAMRTPNIANETDYSSVIATMLGNNK